jgi:hypothetical protein
LELKSQEAVAEILSDLMIEETKKKDTKTKKKKNKSLKSGKTHPKKDLSSSASSNFNEKNSSHSLRNNAGDEVTNKQHTKSKSDTSLSTLNFSGGEKKEEKEDQNASTRDWEIALRKRTKHIIHQHSQQQQHSQSSFRNSNEHPIKHWPVHKKALKIQSNVTIQRQQQQQQQKQKQKQKQHKDQPLTTVRLQNLETTHQHRNDSSLFGQTFTSSSLQSHKGFVRHDKQNVDPELSTTQTTSTSPTRTSSSSQIAKNFSNGLQSSPLAVPTMNQSFIISNGHLNAKKCLSYAEVVSAGNPTSQQINTSGLLFGLATASPFFNAGELRPTILSTDGSPSHFSPTYDFTLSNPMSHFETVRMSQLSLTESLHYFNN